MTRRTSLHLIVAGFYPPLTIREPLIALRAKSRVPHFDKLHMCGMEKLTQLLDLIDSAYRVASTTDSENASLLLLASQHVSRKIEAASGRSRRRSQKAA